MNKRIKGGYSLLLIAIMTIIAVSPLLNILPVQGAAPTNTYIGFVPNNTFYGGHANEPMRGTTINSTWDCTSGMSGFIVSTNATGAWANNSWVPATGTSDVITMDVCTNNDVQNNTDAFKVYANSTTNEWTTSSTVYKFIDMTNYNEGTDPWLSHGQIILKWTNLWLRKGLASGIENIGLTYENNVTYSFTCGNSNGVKVLAIMQEHGDEDHSTESMWTVLNWLFGTSREAGLVLSKLYIKFIPVVNLDVYNRGNANTTTNVYGVKRR